VAQNLAQHEQEVGRYLQDNGFDSNDRQILNKALIDLQACRAKVEESIDQIDKGHRVRNESLIQSWAKGKGKEKQKEHETI
jgi:hypothetical protein